MLNVMSSEMETVGDPRAVIEDLRERYRSQAQQLLLWRRRVKVQEELLARLARERAQQLQALSAQLLLFEARLCRKQKDIAALLAQRESVIARQQRTIRALQGRLADAGLDGPDSPPASNLDSLNDSDSAVIMEEGDHEAPAPGPRARVVVRSVSDALEQPKYPALRRSDGFLRRPEVLETVYSVEEDGEGEVAQSKSEMAAVEGDEATEDSGSGGGRLQGLYGSFERLNDTSTPPPQSQVMTTYNRVMSNHRSVTKPKDVKYKRINKAKSKSLEELRGRLRNWVDKGNKLAVSLDQSYA